jgi:Mg2+-importing ATPase
LSGGPGVAAPAGEAGLGVGVQAYWSLAAGTLLARLSSSDRGLSEASAAQRLARVGPNSVEEQAQATALRLLLRQFESPLVLILLFGAVVSLGLRDWLEASIILAIVCGSALLGFSQEYRASAAVAQLRQRLALTVRVRRDGAEQSVPAAALVPGDVVELAAGNLVPADGLVLEARDFLVTEASLTGESFPVEKRAGVLAPETPLAARTNCVFLGTSVRSGTARALIVATGRATAFGAIAGRLAAQPEETDFARGVRHFGQLLLRVMFLMVLFVLAVNQLLGRPAIESLLFAVALAVGLSPELLPAIVSVTLSRGARAMAQRGVIVRKLEAIENLGSMDVLCTDKTGTLTSGVIDLAAALGPDGEPSRTVRELAYHNAALETGIENPLDQAIVAAARGEGVSIAAQIKVDEIPYDFSRRRLTIVARIPEDSGSHLLITKGAYSNVLSVCSSVARGDGQTALDEAMRAKLDALYRSKGIQGYRVLAVASRRLPAKLHYGIEDESGLCFAGFLLFLDAPKPDAQKTLAALAGLGIRTKIITGDNRYVAAHVGASVGLDPQALLTGEQLAGMRDEALWHLAERTDLFAEVDPQQKERIVRALQRTGHAVGYLGDGINDAPALSAADVGISVDQAVDVARESADVIILRPDLDVLRRGVEDGRRTFVNTLKYIQITTSANFGNMVSMALATPLLPFLPLAAKQILLNNFLSDVPSIAISTDNVDQERLARAQRWDVRGLQHFMLVFGLVSTAFDLVTFFVLLQVFGSSEAVFQTAWFVVSVLTELLVVLVLRTHGAFWRSRPGMLLLWSTVAVSIIAIALPHANGVAAAFGFVPLPLSLSGALVLIVLAYVSCTELAKRVFYRNEARGARH